jgi:hypothetical protein
MIVVVEGLVVGFLDLRRRELVVVWGCEIKKKNHELEFRAHDIDNTQRQQQHAA